ncbi:MAG: IPT/TIG domain-containing protein, partial [Flavobacteriaceae bacterium]|nr:IPT/TIG domain-containing protein [Flavobacteriaceae bacterium]
MKNNIFKRFVLVFISVFISLTATKAQSLLHEVSLSKKIEISSLLVEGEVIKKYSFWDADMKHIYTSNTIEVYKVFKGKLINTTIEVFTLGGVAGLQAEKVFPSLQFQKDNIGLFFLKNGNVKHNESRKGAVSYMPSAGAQSYYAYNLNEGTAAGIFQKYDDISKTLYNEISKITNSDYKEIKEFSVKKKENAVSKAALAITSLSPTSISAGTKSILTISGSGFGDTKGDVKFRNADSGDFFGAIALESQILSWSDAKITVEVPDNAGTGKVQVVATGGASFNSSNNLTITYAEINVPYENNGIEIAYQVQHVNVDGSGGYIWKMHTDFEANA